MISQKMEEELNKQLNEELFSSYLYLSMRAYFEDKNLAGMAQWMKLQTEEENLHAMKFFDYIVRVGGRVKLEAIKKPKFTWKSPRAAFEDALKHEKYITGRINFLVDLAYKEKDHATATFLNWFVDEQVEEEDTVSKIVDSFKLIGNDPSGLFLLDRELSQRNTAGAGEPEN